MQIMVSEMVKKICNAEVIKNESLTSDDKVKKMTLLVPEISMSVKPGQFINLKLADSCYPLLRRPFCIAGADKQDGTITIIYRVVGQGTEIMSVAKQGDSFNLLGPLGNGFTPNSKKPLLIGGGMGLAPLLFLANQFESNGISSTILIGGKNKDEVFWDKLYCNCRDICITTDDGSVGERGFVTDTLGKLLDSQEYKNIDGVYACGPEIMLKKIASICKDKQIPCQVSLENYMACGLGACLSCTIETTSGKRLKVCSDGPVFDSTEVVW